MRTYFIHTFTKNVTAPLNKYANLGVPISVDLDEKTLRDMLASPAKAQSFRALFETIKAGEPVVVRMRDGSRVTLDSMSTATATLIRMFDWVPDIP